MYVSIFLVQFRLLSGPTIGKIAVHSANYMFSWYKYLIFSLVFPHLGFWSGNPFLIAPFPDLCLLVPFYSCFLKKLSIFKNKKNILFEIFLVSFFK